jgi:Protein of unknown function (DUF1275)
MINLDRKLQMIAVGLAVLAGLVDGTGFMASGGFFISFMSGNSTRLAVGLSQSAAFVGFVLAIIGSFVLGVFASSLFGRLTKLTNRQRQSRILMVIALLLAFVPFLANTGHIVLALCAERIGNLWRDLYDWSTRKNRSGVCLLSIWRRGKGIAAICYALGRIDFWSCAGRDALWPNWSLQLLGSSRNCRNIEYCYWACKLYGMLN